MFADDDKPVVGDAGKMLGVRPQYDIPVLPNGLVRPGEGGMSVAPDWRSLPLFLIPRRLNSEVTDAAGSNRLKCFRLAAFPFTETLIEERLLLRPNSPDHGTIEPNREMLIDDFQSALASTRHLWVVDET
jgi:hypothetical protein